MKTKRFLAMVIVLAMVLSLAPLALAADGQTTNLWSGTAAAGGNWWDLVLTADVDGSVLTEGGYLSVYHDVQYPGMNVILGGASNGWAQVTAGDAVASGDGYVTQVSYADLAAAYGAALTDVTSVTIYVSSGETVTVTAIDYTAAGEEGGQEEAPATSYNATLDVDWWKFDYQTVTPGQQTTFTLEVADIAAMNHFAISIADAYADLKDYTPYLLVKVDDNTVYNGACNYWAAWVDGVETNNYYIEPYNAWNEYREIASVPAGSKLTVVLSLGEPIVEEGQEAPTATYVVAGEAALCGSEWDVADTNNLMTDEDGDGVYTKEYTKVAAGWPQFKVVEVLSDGTQNWLTDQPEDWNMWVETKKGDTVTITYEPATGKITYTVTTPPALWETAYLCCAEKDTWWPSVNMETDVKVSTVVTGEGTYTLSWNLNEWGWDTVDGIQVLYIDITNYENLYMYDATNITVTADGEKVPTAWYNAKTYYADGYYRIELYNVYSNSAGVVSSDLTFAENLTVTFDLVKGQPITGDTTPVALAVCLLVLGALGVTALVATKKKHA